MTILNILHTLQTIYPPACPSLTMEIKSRNSCYPIHHPYLCFFLQIPQDEAKALASFSASPSLGIFLPSTLDFCSSPSAFKFAHISFILETHTQTTPSTAPSTGLLMPLALSFSPSSQPNLLGKYSLPFCVHFFNSHSI